MTEAKQDKPKPPAKAPSQPVKKKAAKKPSPPAAGRTASASRSAALVVALLALVLGIALSVAGYFLWNGLQQLQRGQERLVSGVEARVERMKADLATLTARLDAQRDEWHKRLDEARREQRATADRLATLRAVIGRADAGWVLAETEYLLRIANQRLLLHGDVATALAALNGADERLRELGDPHYLPVREQIARERDALEAVPAVDVDGLSSRVSALIGQVDGLPVAASHLPPAESTETQPGGAPPVARDWRELPALIWRSLRELVSIRRHDEPVRPMLPPQREYFLRQNLRLQLEAARLALLRQDGPLFRDSLATARDWLGAYFDRQQPSVQKAIASLDELGGHTIRPALPDISASLGLLRQQRKLAIEPTPASVDTAPSSAAPQSVDRQP